MVCPKCQAPYLVFPTASFAFSTLAIVNVVAGTYVPVNVPLGFQPTVLSLAYHFGAATVFSLYGPLTPTPLLSRNRISSGELLVLLEGLKKGE